LYRGRASPTLMGYGLAIDESQMPTCRHLAYLSRWHHEVRKESGWASHFTLLTSDSCDSIKVFSVRHTIDPYEGAYDILMLPLNELPSWCI
jgi:hypothetical protein